MKIENWQLKIGLLIGSLVFIGSIGIYWYLFSLQARAQESSRSFTVVPPSIQLSLAPGEKTERPLKVRNEGDTTLTFKAMIRDFIVTDKQGTPEILPPGEAPKRWAASSWMMVSPDTITVEPKKTGNTILYLQVPPDAKPGGRYTSVVFEPVTVGGPPQTGAAVVTQVGSLVYLQVKGPITEKAQVVQFSAKNFQEYGPVKILSEIKNLGDLHIRPKGKITISNVFGQNLAFLPLEENNIFPSASRLYENTWGQKWGLGRYRADLAASYGLGNLPLSATFSFWIIPYKALAAVALALAIVILLVIYQRRKKREEETLPPSETSSQVG